MNRKVVEHCPACGDRLVVTRLQCPACETEVRGRFETTVFASLSPEDLAFTEMFVRLRGNVKEMERALGIPYNAVRSRLDALIDRLGFGDTEQVETPERSGERREILDRLEAGEITATEAADLLKAAGREEVSDE